MLSKLTARSVALYLLMVILALETVFLIFQPPVHQNLSSLTARLLPAYWLVATAVTLLFLCWIPRIIKSRINLLLAGILLLIGQLIWKLDLSDQLPAQLLQGVALGIVLWTLLGAQASPVSLPRLAKTTWLTLLIGSLLGVTVIYFIGWTGYQLLVLILIGIAIVASLSCGSSQHMKTDSGATTMRLRQSPLALRAFLLLAAAISSFLLILLSAPVTLQTAFTLSPQLYVLAQALFLVALISLSPLSHHLSETRGPRFTLTLALILGCVSAVTFLFVIYALPGRLIFPLAAVLIYLLSLGLALPLLFQQFITLLTTNARILPCLAIIFLLTALCYAAMQLGLFVTPWMGLAKILVILSLASLLLLLATYRLNNH